MYGYDTVKVLQQVWVVAGQPCGKYLAAVMGATLGNMEAHIGSGAFGRARSRYSPLVHPVTDDCQLQLRTDRSLQFVLTSGGSGLTVGGKYF